MKNDMKYEIRLTFTNDELTSFYFAAAQAIASCAQRKESGIPLANDETHNRVFQRMYNATIKRVENDET